MNGYYSTARRRAWRNLLVCAVNAGLRQGLFTLADGDNLWPRASSHPCDGYAYRFALPDGIPAAAYVADVGWGELRIHATANPVGQLVSVSSPTLAAGDAFAVGFLERKESKWLQRSTSLFRCRREMMATLAALEIEPDGYADFGRLII